MDDLLAVDAAARDVAVLAEQVARARGAEGARLLHAVAVLLGEVQRARRGPVVWPVGSVPELLERLADVLDALPHLVPADGPALPRLREARRLCEAARAASRQ